MKAKYVGDTNNPDEKVPDEFEAFGLKFSKGKYTDIPPEMESKFIGNSHFEEQGKPESDEGKAAA